MKTTLIKTAGILGLMMLAACGGSGTSPTTPRPDPEPTDPGPASTAPAALVDYVIDGGSEVYNYHSNRNNITRLQRTTTVDGEVITVTMDQLEGGSNGLIQYRRGDGVTLYQLDDTLVAVTDTPDGQYNGAFEVSYSVDGGQTWEIGSGDAGVVLNTTTGQADFGGMATANRGDGGTSSVEYYSTAELVDGVFVDNSALVVYREDGQWASDHEGQLSGMVLEDGVVGVVGANDGNFQATGGFTLSRYLGD